MTVDQLLEELRKHSEIHGRGNAPVAFVVMGKPDEYAPKMLAANAFASGTERVIVFCAGAPERDAASGVFEKFEVEL